MKKTFLIIPLALVVLYLFLTYFYPLYSIFRETVSFKGEEFSPGFTLLWKTIRFTFKESLLSTFFTLILGLAGAAVFSLYKFPGKRLAQSLISIPFMLPTVVVSAGFNALLGPNGWVNQLLKSLFSLNKAPIHAMNTLGIIIAAHVFYNTSLVIRMVSGAWAAIDLNIPHAAAMLGARKRDIAAKIYYPLLKSSVISSALLVFLFDFTSYGVVLMMGGPKYKTLEVEISYQTLQTLDLKTAGFLTVIQLLITLLIVIGEQKVKMVDYRLNKVKVFDENQKKPRRFSEKFFVYGYLALILGLTLLPLGSLVFQSFYTAPAANGAGGGFSLGYYRALFANEKNSFFFVPPGKAVLYSMLNALMCSGIAVFFGLLLCSFSRNPRINRLVQAFVLLPIGTSAVTLGLGYLIAYRKNITNVWVTPLAHSIVVLPFVIRTLQPAITRFPENLRQSAQVLGADPLYFLRKVYLPMIRKPLLNSVVFAFTISMGEFGATSFLSRPERPTLPVAIYNYLSKPGALNYGQAMAMSTILLGISLLSIFIINEN